MKARTRGWMIVAVVAWTLGGIGLDGRPQAARAQVTVSVDTGFFYDRLTPYGDWREHAKHGWVWYPRDLPFDWRPYTLGHWVYTDDYGWLWDSDEDWGWACFHYGRWDWDDDLGWFWVPGYEWGPAWVAWRNSPDLGSPTPNTALGGPFIGWCPLPPGVTWQVGVGLDLHGVDLDILPARRWAFVSVGLFVEPRLHEHIVLVSRNVTLLRETRNVTHFETVRGRIVDNSISVNRIEEVTHRAVQHVQVEHVKTAGAARAAGDRGNEIRVFSPSVKPAAGGVKPPPSSDLETHHAAERAQIQERQQAEAARQQEHHAAERTAPSADPEQLNRRHEAETQALQSEHEHQRHQLENHQRRESMRARGPSGAGGEKRQERTR